MRIPARMLATPHRLVTLHPNQRSRPPTPAELLAGRPGPAVDASTQGTSAKLFLTEETATYTLALVLITPATLQAHATTNGGEVTYQSGDVTMNDYLAYAPSSSWTELNAFLARLFSD